jgi:D-glycero-D-manno-heptose 1,7-bisphosphate phosphatase
MRRAVFLDRDGVLNRAELRKGKLAPPCSPAEVELLPGAAAACATLRAAGYLLIVVTNQPDVSRKTQRRKTVEAINAAIRARVPLDDFRVCYHDDRDDCCCRKPRPGLLLEAAKDWEIDLRRSFLIGDRWKDIQAARNAGCRGLLVENHIREKRLCRPHARFASLEEAARWILAQQ